MKTKRTHKLKRPGQFAEAHGSATVNRRLLNAVTALMDIVEGTRNVRWQHEGRRLVDTPQWCDLYCAWCAEKRESPNEKGQR